jgi:hypothetical protein
VEFLPPTFNRDVLFELPLVERSVPHSHARLMHGMDKRHNGHAWTRTTTSHIKNDMNLTFWTSTCVGHLRCENRDCEYIHCIHHTSLVNETEWDKFIPIAFAVGQPAPNSSSLVCKLCIIPPDCIVACNARIYFVFGPTNMTRACFHLGHHEYLVKPGEDMSWRPQRSWWENCYWILKGCRLESMILRI